MTWPQPLEPSAFSAHRLPGEQVLWSGRPDPARIFQPADVVLIPFSLLWGGFAIFWEAMVILGGAPWGMALFGLPFVAIGLHLIIGRFFHRAWVNRRTWYVLTDRRAVIGYGASGQHVRSVALEKVGDVSVSRRGDGSGTVAFGPTPGGAVPAHLGAGLASGRASLQRGPVAFVNIPDVDTVRGLADSFSRGLR